MTDPGPELDIRVAERFLGWEWLDVGLDCDGANQCRVLAPYGLVPSGYTWPPKGKLPAHFHCRRWSTSIKDAWQLVERLNERRYKVTIEQTGAGARCDVLDNGVVVGTAQAPTTPHAICLAALDAVGAAKETAA